MITHDDLSHLRTIVDEQAEDGLLWGQPATMREAALQVALRDLHAEIERLVPPR